MRARADRRRLPRPGMAPGARAPRSRARRLLDLLSWPLRFALRRRWRWRLALWAIVLTVGIPLLSVGVGRFVDPPLTWLMVQRIVEGRSLSQRSVALDRVSPHLVAAVIAAEDTRFCSHRGFDADAILDAMAHNAEGGPTRGASTISQQTAKNVFLWPARSWLRKGLEAYFTVLIELVWPKRRILEAYLGVAEWGPGVFGAQAAARHWFGKDASALDADEAARLAAILPSPNKWRPDAPGPYVRRRAATIRSRAQVVRAQGLDACVMGARGGSR